MRCAIYTRKSDEEGLAQPFNSLDAQRESAEAYILSQQHAGWILLAERYDDGGFTGAHLERPGLQRLLSDLGAGSQWHANRAAARQYRKARWSH
jgi:site-specific DNA recombinase